MTSAIPTELLSQLGNGDCEFVIYQWKVKNANEYMKDHIYLNCGEDMKT